MPTKVVPTVAEGGESHGEPVLVQFVRLWITPVGVVGLLGLAWWTGQESAQARTNLQHLTVTVEKMDTRLEGVADTISKAANGLESLRSRVDGLVDRVGRLTQRMDLIESRMREVEKAK